MPDRTCGGCTACCFTHEVPAIRKPLAAWCKHCTVGGGCTIYETKPLACNKYSCAWLSGVGADADRPDKANAVFDLIQKDVFCGADVLEFQDILEGASEQAGLQAIIQDHLARGTNVYVSTSGKEDSLYVLAQGNTLPRDKRRMLRKKKVSVLVAAEYTARLQLPAT
jgi:hypothetical protein